MKKYLLIFVLAFIIFIPKAYALVSTNTGFLSNQIWYSKDSLIEGDIVSIYTAIWNADDSSLSAKVEFYDKNVILGSRNVVIPPKVLKEVSVSWKVTSGDHVISAKIISSSLNSNSGTKETVVLKSNTTSTDRKFVPVTVKTADGKLSTNNNLIKDQITKVTKKISGIVPESVSTSVVSGTNNLDTLRSNTLEKIIKNKKQTKRNLLSYSSSTSNKNLQKDQNLKPKQTIKSSSILKDSTKKPITQVKLFFLTVLVYIFSHKVIFYGLLILILFHIFRVLYRKIVNRY